MAISSLFFFVGCSAWQKGSFLGSDPYSELRTYEKDVGSRIEQFLEIAEQELKENFERKQYLMIREEQPVPVLHPRKDVDLREIIFSSHKQGNISDDQMTAYLARCDELYTLWEEHWRIARKKGNRLGFER